MRVVYHLRDDRQRIAAVQRATLHTDTFGIEPTHGLFGSEEWWQQIADGRLPLQTVRGTITRTWMGSMGDWPECEITSETGEKSTWTRYADDCVYRIGRQIEIDYVVQNFRPAAWMSRSSPDHPVVIEVRVEAE